jgi:excisionase family DNA binding protein
VPDASATLAASAGDRSCRSVRQVARYWRTSPVRVRQLVRRGILRAFMLGRSVRISPEAIAEAERLLAVPVAGPRRQRVADGIAPEVVSLLNGD